MTRLTWSILLLFSVALGLYVTSIVKQEAVDETLTTSSTLKPSYQATNLMTQLFDENGLVNHEVFAAGMLHYNDEQQEFIEFSQPVYTLFSDNTPSWRVTAQKGTLYNYNVVKLDGNVTVANLSKNRYVTSARSDFVEMQLEQQLLLSDHPVTISGPRYTVSGNGFSADLKTQYYELQNHVETIFAPYP